MTSTCSLPWEKCTSSFLRALLIFAASLILLLSEGITVRAEEPAWEPVPEENWLADFTCSIDEAKGILQLTEFIGTTEHLVIPGTTEQEGRNYRVQLTPGLFDSTNGAIVKSLYLCSGVRLPDRCNNLFFGLSSVESLVFGPDMDSANVTSMLGCFRNLSSLRSLDLSMLDTENVTTFESLFSGCKALESVELSGLDTGKVITFYGMFQYCESLETLDVSALDMSSAILVMNMFSGCKGLTSLDLTGWNTEKLTNMSGFLQNAKALKEIDLSILDTSKVITFSYLFFGCTALERVNLSGLNMDSATNFSSMFMNNTSLTDVNLAGISAQSPQDLSYMFSGCSALKELDLSAFDLSGVTNTQYMLKSASALRKIITPKAMGSLSTDLQYSFYPRDESGSLIMENKYTVLENAPTDTPIYFFHGFIVIFSKENYDSENQIRQMIEYDQPTPLRLNTFVKEGHLFMGWSRTMNSSAAEFSDGQVVTNLWEANTGMYLFPVWRPIRGFTFIIPATAQLTGLEPGVLGAEIPYSIAYTGRDADCIRIQISEGKISDSFGHELTLNCWNTRPNWFVLEDGGGTLNEDSGFYEGTGVITVSVNNAFLEGERAGLYTGTLTVTVGYL